MEITEDKSNPYSMFIYAIRSPLTRDYYLRRLRSFFDFIDLEVQETIDRRCILFAHRSKQNSDWSFNAIIKFLQFQKERVENGEITGATLRNFVKAIKLFCEMSDIPVQWKKIGRGLPKIRRFADDRAPTIEEIRRIVEYPDRRIKAVVYTMASSGIRLGAWDYLRWGHIRPIERDGKIAAAKIIVYAGDDEEYNTFITAEAYFELEKWMAYRMECGEVVNDKSWVMRQLWNTKKGHTHGLVTVPRKLRSAGVKRLMEDALWTQGLRKKLDPGRKRHEFQADHGLGKWFKTRCEISGMKPINIETLMNHSVGISDSYYRATESELLDDYLKATEYLTLNNEEKLRNEVNKLESHISNFETVEFQLQVKTNEIESMKLKYEQGHETVQNLLRKFGANMEDVIKKFGQFNVDPIIVDGQLQDGDTIGSLQVIHTPGHTPGHIALYSEKHKIMFGADSLFKSVLGVDGLFIPPEVAYDPLTAAISVRRMSQKKFDKLLLAHQDSPMLEGAQKSVEKAASVTFHK